MLGDFFGEFMNSLLSSFWRVVGIIIGVIVLVFFLGLAIGHCTTVKPCSPHLSCRANEPRILPGITNNQPCEAPLDKVTCDQCQKILNDYGHGNLRILEGMMVGTPAAIRKKTFTIVLKCVGPDCNIYAVGLIFKENNMTNIKIKPTGEQHIPS